MERRRNLAGVSNRVAIVTGASRGIGAHVTTALVSHGWSVMALSLSGASPAQGNVVSVACDVTEVDDVQRAVDATIDRFGAIDLLVNNAGVIEPEVPLWESDVDTWWGVMEVNVRGPFLLTRAVVPHMIDGGGGRIINLNSGAGTVERPDLTAYCASKSALARITGGVALAGAEHEVRAFDLAPGVVRTDMSTSMRLHAYRSDWTDPDEVTDMLIAIADGRLDAFSGRMIRVGADTIAALEVAAAVGLDSSARKLRLLPWGHDDPLFEAPSPSENIRNSPTNGPIDPQGLNGSGR